MKPFGDKPPTNPPPTQRDITDTAWDKRAAEGYLMHVEGKDLAPFFENFYAAHQAELGPDVLDIGCGMGRYLIPMVQRGLNVTGVEPSDGMRHGAEEKLQEVGLQARIIKGQSAKLDFPSDNFDFVVSIGAIHHNMWPDIQKSFAEVARVLKPGKFFLFQCRSIKDFAKQRRRIIDSGYTAVDLKGSKRGVNQHYFTMKELEQLATENGFEIAVEPYEELKVDKADSKKQGARWWVVYRKI